MKTGFSFFTIIFFILLVLKLTNHIDTSWILVLLPLALPIMLWVLFIVFIVAVLGAPGTSTSRK
jgi:hypothetical protein